MAIQYVATKALGRVVLPRTSIWSLTHLTLNIAEALNSWLLEAHELPILPMFERIRHQLMNWFTKRRDLEMNTTGSIVSHIAEKIETIIRDRAHRYRFSSSDNIQFEVRSGVTTIDYLVNLELRTCSCFQWQSTGYPYPHTIAILITTQQNPQLYTVPFFTLENYRSTYSAAIFHPLTGDYALPLAPLCLSGSDDQDGTSDSDSLFDEEEEMLLPPSTRRPAGRPKKRRIRRTLEGRSLQSGRHHRHHRCSRCKGQGHSRRMCREAIP